MPREHERTEFLVKVEIVAASGHREAYISDLSRTGCYVDTRVEVNETQAVSFHLIHPNGGRLGFAGNVVHYRPGVGFGLQFSNVNPEQKLFLDRMAPKN